jgi:hypothetical protein
VVPCNKHAPTSGPKGIYSAAVFLRQAVPDIHGEEPQLIIVAVSKVREKRIGRPERISVPRPHLENRMSRLVSFLAEQRGEK